MCGELVEGTKSSGVARVARVARPAELAGGPLALPQNWVALVNAPLTVAEESALRRSIRRGQPIGKQEWAQSVVKSFALESTQRNQGRPRKHTPSGPALLFENGF